MVLCQLWLYITYANYTYTYKLLTKHSCAHMVSHVGTDSTFVHFITLLTNADTFLIKQTI